MRINVCAELRLPWAISLYEAVQVYNEWGDFFNVGANSRTWDFQLTVI